MKKEGYKFKVGSELFETSVMKTDEVVLFIKTAVENGSSLEDAYDDMNLIDDLLHMQRLHIAVHGFVRRTKAGHLRKGTSLYDSFERIIESRIKK